MQNIPTALGPLWRLVVAVALVRGDGRVLLQRRAAGGAHAGLWEFPGGKVEPGEAPETAAARELHEELGLVVAPAGLIPAGFAAEPAGAGAGACAATVIGLYSCRAWAGVPVAMAAAELGWFAPGAVPGLAMPPLDYPLARALLGCI